MNSIIRRALAKLDGLRDDAAFRYWLYRVVVSVHRNRCRQAFWRRLVPLGGHELASEPRVDDALGAADRARLALATLPAEQREAIVLFELEGWHVDEIAALLGGQGEAPATVPPATVPPASVPAARSPEIAGARTSDAVTAPRGPVAAPTVASPFPDGYPAVLGAEAFERVVDDGLRDCLVGESLVGISCEEPYCVAALRVGPGALRSLAECAAWQRSYGGTEGAAYAQVDCPDGHEEIIEVISPELDAWSGWHQLPLADQARIARSVLERGQRLIDDRACARPATVE